MMMGYSFFFLFSRFSFGCRIPCYWHLGTVGRGLFLLLLHETQQFAQDASFSFRNLTTTRFRNCIHGAQSRPFFAHSQEGACGFARATIRFLLLPAFTYLHTYIAARRGGDRKAGYSEPGGQGGGGLTTYRQVMITWH